MLFEDVSPWKVNHAPVYSSTPMHLWGPSGLLKLKRRRTHKVGRGIHVFSVDPSPLGLNREFKAVGNQRLKASEGFNTHG